MWTLWNDLVLPKPKDESVPYRVQPTRAVVARCDCLSSSQPPVRWAAAPVLGFLSAGTGCTQVTVGSRRGSRVQLYGLPKAALCSHLSHGSAVMHRRCGELVGMSLLLRVSLLSLLSQPPAQLQLSLMRVLISVAKWELCGRNLSFLLHLSLLMFFPVIITCDSWEEHYFCKSQFLSSVCFQSLRVKDSLTVITAVSTCSSYLWHVVSFL